MINEFKKQSLNTWLRQLEGGPDLEGVFKGERRGGGREKGWGEGEGPAARTDQAINIMILQVPRPPFFYKLPAQHSRLRPEVSLVNCLLCYSGWLTANMAEPLASQGAFAWCAETD